MRPAVFRICIGLIVLLTVAWGAIRIGVFTLKIPGSSMTPTFPANSLVVVERFSYALGEPRRGDLVVFKSDAISNLAPGILHLRRVIGLPGERLILSNGVAIVNGSPVIISNRAGPIALELPNSAGAIWITNITIPPSNYFVIGDNAKISMDSRFYGPIPRANITGHALE